MTRAAFMKLTQDEAVYPTASPYDPDQNYPEFEHLEPAPHSQSRNSVFAGIRQLFIELGLDSARMGSASWNPLGDYVRTGQTVVIKPNLVIHKHFSGPQGMQWTVTHPSVVRALIDYCRLAVGPTGHIVIADTPLEDCDFREMLLSSGYGEMIQTLYQRGIQVDIHDLRSYQSLNHLDGTNERLQLPGDPEGYTDCDLADESLFSELEKSSAPRNYYTMGDHSVDQLKISSREAGMPTVNHHHGRHTYRVANTILNADLTINVAKMKTHKFSGVTLCLKNAIGICNGKEYMPHRRPGPPSEGGDSFPAPPSLNYQWRVRRVRVLSSIIGRGAATWLIAAARRIVPRPLPHLAPWEPLFGDWSGNDTIWRTTVDLNRIWLRAKSTGNQDRRECGKMLCVIDGVVGMDHEGPMTGMPVQSSVLVMAKDPVAADTLGALLMGFDPRNIPTIEGAARLHDPDLGLPLSEDAVHGNVPLASARTRFVPNRGWVAALGDDFDRGPFPLNSAEAHECELV